MAGAGPRGGHAGPGGGLRAGSGGAMARAGRPRLGLTTDDVAAGHLELFRSHGGAPRGWAGAEPLEVCYAFADLDPLDPESYSLSSYFGSEGRMDLGQFQRYRRVLLSPRYRPLLGHVTAELQSRLLVAEGCKRFRYWVEGWRPGEEGVYEFVLAQRCGGRHDGCWFVRQVLREESCGGREL